MECDRYTDNGQAVVSTPQAWACGVKRKFGDGGMRVGGPGGRSAGAGRLLAPGALLAGSAMLAGGICSSPRRRPEPRPTPRAPLPRVVADSPFMNNMDEITFWIVTKRAPCLAGYNNPLRRVQPQCSRTPLHSTSPEDQGEPERKRKKIILINDDSDSTEKQNVFFGAPQPECVISDEKSDTLVSDVGFNIKKPTVQAKNKRQKMQNKNSCTALHKKRNMVTSTPKVTSNLRRSSRKVQPSLNNNTNLNSTLDIFDTANGDECLAVSKCLPEKYDEDEKLVNIASREQNTKTCAVSVQRPNNGTMNGQYDDLSDVSGFTANYIKSTKINSKTPRKRSKQSRNLAKESRQSGQKEEKSLIVSINKTARDPKNTVLNCSPDSSQNLINMGAVDKNAKGRKRTPTQKYMEGKKGQKGVNNKSDALRNGVLNTSFQSTSTTGSRYPKRNKNNLSDMMLVELSEKTDPSKLSADKKTATNQSSRLESSGKLSRTRSGRSRHSKVPECSVPGHSDLIEQESTVPTDTMASVEPNEARDSSKKKRTSTKSNHARKSMNKTEQSAKDSFREKSGFAACFSDSDDDKPLKPQKYLS